jgi:hypothetical protein
VRRLPRSHWDLEATSERHISSKPLQLEPSEPQHLYTPLYHVELSVAIFRSFSHLLAYSVGLRVVRNMDSVSMSSIPLPNFASNLTATQARYTGRRFASGW